MDQLDNQQGIELTDTEITVYNDIMNKWLEVANVVGAEEVINKFTDKTTVSQIYSEVLPYVEGDTASAGRITQYIVDNVLKELTSLGKRAYTINDQEEDAPIEQEYSFIEQEHPFKELVTPLGDKVKIDEDIVPLVEALWQKGFNTSLSCQQGPEENCYIEFETGEDYQRFLSLVKDQVSLITNTYHDEDCESLTVGFYREDIPKIMKILSGIDKQSSLNLRRYTWDNPQKSEDYHPGSNTGAGGGSSIPHKTPKSLSELPREEQRTKEDYSTLSLIERDFEEEHPGAIDRGSGPDAHSGGGAQSHSGEPGRIDNIYPEPMNWLRPFKKLPIPPLRYNQNFNEDFDTEYTQRQYGKLNLRRKKLAKHTLKISEKVFDFATIQISDIPQSVISQIKSIQSRIDKDILNNSQDSTDGWIKNGLQQNFHITVLYGVSDSVREKVQEIFDEFKSITIQTDGIDYFDTNQDEGTVAIVKCKSKGLSQLHSKLKDSIKNKHRLGEYKAHITIAYLKDGERLPDKTFKDIEWSIGALELSKTAGTIEKIASPFSTEGPPDKPQNPPGLENVCAWCHHSYDIDGNRLGIEPLPDEVYNTVQSHGICNECREEQMRNVQGSNLSLKKAIVQFDDSDEGDNFTNIFNKSIIQTLADPNTPEDILLKYLNDMVRIDPSRVHEATRANYIQVLNLIRDHPNLTDEEGRWLAQTLLVDFNAVQTNDMENFDDIDERREQTTEIPQLSSQEASMLENHSVDEIWNMAAAGDPIAQALINSGTIASSKRIQKQALFEWTPLADDLLIPEKGPYARRILSLIKKEALVDNLNSVNDFGRVIFDEFPKYGGDANSLRMLYSRFIKATLPYTVNTPTIIKKTPRWKHLFSSILDAPREVLDPAIWQDGPNEIPMLRPHVKLKIVEQFFSYIYQFGGYIKPELWIKNMFYTGSTATYRYNDRSDIDIHIVIDWHDMLTLNPDKNHENLEDVWRELHDTFWWTLNKDKLEGTKHPIQYYVVKPGEEKKIVDQKEEIYDIGHDVWLIPPAKGSEASEEVLQEAVNTSSEVMNRIDQQISDARKGLIDYALLTEIITPENAKDVYQHLSQKVSEIDKALKELKVEYDDLKTKRQEAFIDTTVDSNFSLNNVIFKFVERYKYLDVLRKIKRLTNDMDLAPDQVPDVAEIFGLKELFEQEMR